MVGLPTDLNGEDHLGRKVDLLAGPENHKQGIRAADCAKALDQRVVPTLALSRLLGHFDDRIARPIPGVAVDQNSPGDGVAVEQIVHDVLLQHPQVQFAEHKVGRKVAVPQHRPNADFEVRGIVKLAVLNDPVNLIGQQKEVWQARIAGGGEEALQSFIIRRID